MAHFGGSMIHLIEDFKSTISPKHRSVGSVLVALAVVLFIYSHWDSSIIFSSYGPQLERTSDRFFSTDQIKLKSDPESIRNFSRQFAANEHLAGDIESSDRARSIFEGFGLETRVDEYEVLLNKPIKTSLSIFRGNTNVWTADLNEEVNADPASKANNFGWHGYSAEGQASGPLIYVNYGLNTDFDMLESKGINVSGSIVLARYGGGFRGLKVKEAQKRGALGVLIYDDLQGDHNITIYNNYTAWPFGPARNPTTVQRGSVADISLRSGDPTTPGYPSKPGCERQDGHVDGHLPSIPSFPISYANAIELLKTTQNQGIEIDEWKGLLNVTYFTGPSNSSVHMNNDVAYDLHPIYDVIGIINGTSRETVILGAHRDAWVNGAIDPISGTASMLEIAKIFTRLVRKGWKPRRTIIFASWDAEEYGLVGSTEWVEEYAPLHDVVAYLNLDVASSGGPTLRLGGSPILFDVIEKVARSISYKNGTLWDLSGSIRTLGSGSDYSAFLDNQGIPSFDTSFNGQNPYFYHSQFDSTMWLEKYGDPGYQFHALAADFVAALLYEISEPLILPFNVETYAKSIEKYVDNIVQLAKSNTFSVKPHKSPLKALKVLTEASEKLAKDAKKFEKHVSNLRTQIAELELTLLFESRPWYLLSLQVALNKLDKKVRKINKRYLSFEKAFLVQDGLEGRPFFKHLLFAPDLNKGYAGSIFPSLIEAIEAGNQTLITKWIGVSVDRLSAASKILQP